jgi:hypothetical protein
MYGFEGGGAGAEEAAKHAPHPGYFPLHVVVHPFDILSSSANTTKVRRRTCAVVRRVIKLMWG